MNDRRYNKLYEATFGAAPVVIEVLTPHGSSREYVKITSTEGISCIGTHGSDPKENLAFILFSKHLGNAKVAVPKVLSHTDDYQYYLQDDLGSIDLFSILQSEDNQDQVRTLLKRAVDVLIEFQYKGHEFWNYENSYPFAEFNTEEISRDLVRFENEFLRRLGVEYSHSDLHNEIEMLCVELNNMPDTLLRLMHRDFQARNILVHDDQFYVIDFQGSRRGPVHYDLASLLVQSQLHYSDQLKKEIIEYYMDKAGILDGQAFMKHFHILTFVRLMQSIGSYGIAGLGNQKPYFLRSIPFALRNFGDGIRILENNLQIKLPAFEKARTDAEQEFLKTYKHES